MPTAIGGYVLDVAALVGACRRHPYPEAVVWGTVLTDGVIVVPAAVLAEARARIPVSGTDILEAILGLPNTVIVDLDPVGADRCGVLLSRLTDDEREKVSAAQATAEAISRGWPVATDRGSLLNRLDPEADVDQLP
ncbi:hypothetical protein [Nocardia sp. NPDC051570]|uniref:hypothetical protein n=1 Tax=Nocardia sp. NPDC051570 TaxID=3364324 RepID=UPI0037AE3B14